MNEEKALCRQHDPELWFSNQPTPPGPVPRTKKKKPKKPIPVAVLICHQCPIETECLEYALTRRMDYGIWGGLTEAQRRRITHPRRRVS